MLPIQTFIGADRHHSNSQFARPALAILAALLGYTGQDPMFSLVYLEPARRTQLQLFSDVQAR